MNAHAKIADSHSLQFEFEELEIEEGGVSFGCFSGLAELALNDPANMDFYVKSIVINGDKYDSHPMRFGLTIRKRVPGYLALTRPAKDCSTFAAHLFRAIETALYENEAAKEAWAAELEDA